ncbi:TetR/AcrR family transcriptional regulator [Pseudonocardia humida]|uniref:TetR family transcriptional regulator C-terminal domain-containing protein n=1 Tax=Pseudonocardia humida TaxID=2800819 RepID=A0ABT0ZY31_9PSEU|nr:TetR family transcriptional regulator C-terminal domain-containing protein [Pseudonocardia humida]MCO1655616.1 TetR family transcriptional regulator C-terminal domain-containing protein [Pseudonocardia humida]
MPRIPATQRRAALARAALAVASRDGLAAASTRAIVAEAGMPLASFHYAVASRDELLGDVVALVVAEERAAALAALVSHARDPREAIRLALLGYLDQVRADPGREQAMFELTQHALRTEGLDGLPREQYARYRETALDVLVAGARRLGFDWRVPPADLARLLVMVTDGLTLAWLADRDDAAAERAVDLAADALAGFVVARAGAEGRDDG